MQSLAFRRFAFEDVFFALVFLFDTVAHRRVGLDTNRRPGPPLIVGCLRKRFVNRNGFGMHWSD